MQGNIVDAGVPRTSSLRPPRLEDDKISSSLNAHTLHIFCWIIMICRELFPWVILGRQAEGAYRSSQKNRP